MNYKIITFLTFVIIQNESEARSRKLGKRQDYEIYEQHDSHQFVPSYYGNENGHEVSYETSQHDDGNSQAQNYLNHPSTNQHSTYQDSAELNSSKHHKGYSVGSGLRSIAQGSANQAHTAVANQHAAGTQAAYVAKNTLAQAALQAAATAHAALKGKEVLLHEIEHQLEEARKSLNGELSQLILAKKSAKSAHHSAIEATNHVAALQSTLNSAQSVAKQAEEAAHKAADELASQTSMVGKAKSRVESLENQYKAASIDFVATKEATIKAAAAAQEAQKNAEEAASHAAIELQNSATSSLSSEHNGGT